MLHKVRMLSTQKGVHDGEIYPVAFLQGEEYEVGPALLGAFVELGAVELVEEDEKSRGAAPANKAKKAAPENKSR